MDPIAQFKSLAEYNTWMNRRVYEVAAELTDDERKRDLHAFFGSIHRTLNHLLLTDRVQLGRFIGTDRTQSRDADGRPIAIRSLDQELYSDFAVLRREREKTDALIESWTSEITPEFLAGELEYSAMSAPGRYRVAAWLAVTHYFNHQTHHRGQITTMLSQLGKDPGVTDLMALFRVRIS
ncbi:MAG TPA: DinB family protein [Candidatus Acidoferrales bacterium]|nr:DinB family protein [Candidatus Acidoferrales bacterium]